MTLSDSDAKKCVEYPFLTMTGNANTIAKSSGWTDPDKYYDPTLSTIPT